MFSTYDDGTEVEITIRGKVRNQDGTDLHEGALRVRDESGFSHWVFFGSGSTPVDVIAPPHSEVIPGQVWQTLDGPYFARISRLDLPVRMTPYDMSKESGLRTLEVNDFFNCYPDAIITYNPEDFRYVATGPTLKGLDLGSGSGNGGAGSQTTSGGGLTSTASVIVGEDNGCSFQRKGGRRHSVGYRPNIRVSDER